MQIIAKYAELINSDFNGLVENNIDYRIFNRLSVTLYLAWVTSFKKIAEAAYFREEINLHKT